MRRAQLIYTVLSFLCLIVYEIVAELVEPEEGRARQNDSRDCGTKSCLNSEDRSSVNFKMSAWDAPTDQR